MYDRRDVVIVATQSFTKSFSVNKKNAKKIMQVLNSQKKITFKRDFSATPIKKEMIRDFLGLEKQE